ncbi:glycosyltransferase family 39 protein [Lentzea sp. NPDC005914]|uniref:ArnT family glycosyltransferase n=1 Tax=Lentzea sp. NPDC005914 TaxID=3154572 RepID=UPI0033F5E9BC
MTWFGSRSTVVVEEESAAIVALPEKHFRPRPAHVMTVVLVVGGVLRVWALDAIGFNSDEAVYAGQAASIAGDDTLSSLFPIFRAHPLLFQTLLSVGFLGGVSDLGARLLSVVFGLGTIVLVYLLGNRLYNREAGLVAASILAVMPYHVIVTRQVLLDGPQTFFAVLMFYCVTRYCIDRNGRWLHLAAAAIGLAVLTKEIAVILLFAVVAFFLLRREIRVPSRTILLSAGVALVIVAAYPVSLLFSGRTSTGQNYLLWQLFRRANHSLAFYGVEVLPSFGPAVLLLAAGGFWFLRRQNSWREVLLACWILVPLGFFEVWPVKGYQYLLLTAPAVALLAARAMTRISLPQRYLHAALVAVVLLSLIVPSWLAVNPAPSATYLAGSGGVPTGREAGQWIKANLPQGGTVMTLGPTMANLVRFYGNRRAYALSVSTNPLQRNPSYEPIDNPDRQLREGALSYVVWDAYSASRAPFFSQQLMGYVEKYHGVALHTETLDVSGVSTPVIIVYEVRP